MGIRDIFQSIISKPKLKAAQPTPPGGDIIERPGIEDGTFKAYIPNFLYKPPFGYPRPENLPLLKQFSKNAYIHSVINNLQEEAAGNKWEIVPKDPKNPPANFDELKKKISNFLENPNGNKEGFSHILKAVVRDISELDSGVWVKVFNKKDEMVQIFARDGGTFLKNPDIYGYMGGREDVIQPDNQLIIMSQNDETAINFYGTLYATKAAYFQYGWTVASMPVPFGKREVVYFMKNPRSDSVYGVSPISILADIILTLVYGSMYNLDFYMNSNMPEGILAMIGAQPEEIKAFKEKFERQFRTKDEVTGFYRKTGFKIPVTNAEPKFVPFQLSSREMEIIGQQQWFTKLVWMVFGLSADDMGFTEDSNKAVSQTMEKRYAKKAVRPILRLIEERINMEIIPEFGTTDVKFKFDDYDLDEDIRRHTLYQSQITMGIKTPEMVAEEEGIDISVLKKQKEEQEAKDMEKFQAENQFNNNPKEEKIKPKIKATQKIRIGTEVKVISAGDLAGKHGKIERIHNDDTYDVRFDVGIDRFTSQEFVILTPISEIIPIVDKSELLEVNSEVKVISPGSFAGKKGKIEDVYLDNTYVVRFEVGIDRFARKELVALTQQNNVMSTIKAETDIDKFIIDNLKEKTKEINKALSQVKDGNITNIS